jgi:transposase
MRGDDQQLQSGMFSYVALEDRIPADHPLRGVRKLVDSVLTGMSKDFDGLYSEVGRPSIAPERLLRALLLQVFYSVRSERLLVEQLNYNLLFRWFVGLEIDDAVWNHAVFSKNRDRLLNQDLAQKFFVHVKEQAAGLEPAHIRKADIEKNEIRFQLKGPLNRFCSISCLSANDPVLLGRHYGSDTAAHMIVTVGD